MKLKLIALSVTLACLVFVVSGSAKAAKAPDGKSKNKKSMLWTVQSDTAKVYLLGSIHAANESIYPLNGSILKALQDSQVLTLEANHNKDDQKNIQQLTVKYGFYQGTDSLLSTISKSNEKKLAQDVKSEVRQSGLPLAEINKMKPWLAALTLAMAKMKTQNVRTDLGIENYIINNRPKGMKIEELESTEFQLGLFGKWSDETQVHFLKNTISDLNKSNFMGDLLNAWKNADLKFIEEQIINPLKSDKKSYPIYKQLILDRNINMAKKITKYLKSNKTVFVVVGAAHLLGSDGILKLLMSKGHSVVQNN